eukprot:6212908-Pleurochrysis_carterae.AAC.2
MHRNDWSEQPGETARERAPLRSFRQIVMLHCCQRHAHAPLAYWCTRYQLVYPLPTGVPVTNWCTRYQLVYPLPTGVPVTNWCTHYQLVYPLPTGVPVTNWCTDCRLVYPLPTSEPIAYQDTTADLCAHCPLYAASDAVLVRLVKRPSVCTSSAANADAAKPRCVCVRRDQARHRVLSPPGPRPRLRRRQIRALHALALRPVLKSSFRAMRWLWDGESVEVAAPVPASTRRRACRAIKGLRAKRMFRKKSTTSRSRKDAERRQRGGAWERRGGVWEARKEGGKCNGRDWLCSGERQ